MRRFFILSEDYDMSDTEKNDIIKRITDAVFLEENQEEKQPEKSRPGGLLGAIAADTIIIASGSFPEPAAKAAELYKAGYAQRIIIGGASTMIKTDKAHKKCRIAAESMFYREMLSFLGVDMHSVSDSADQILSDGNAHNKNNGQGKKTAILVCKAYLAARTLAAYKLAFPEAEFIVIRAESEYLNRENWYLDREKAKIVLEEAAACGFDFGKYDPAAVERILFET